MLGRRYKSQVNPFGGPFLRGVNPIVPHLPVKCKLQRGRRGPSNSINCLSEGAGFSDAPDLIIPGLHVQACSSGTDVDHGTDATISGFGRAATFVDGLPSLARPNPDIFSSPSSERRVWKPPRRLCTVQAGPKSRLFSPPQGRLSRTFFYVLSGLTARRPQMAAQAEVRTTEALPRPERQRTWHESR